MNKLTISVNPADDLIDVPRQILVSGAAPGELILVASQTERAGVIWRSSAHFVADANGHVDLSLAPAVSGDYSGISAMGLLWAQCPDQQGQRALFHDDVRQPLTTTLA